MCSVYLRIQCSGPLSTGLSDNVVRTELSIESIISTTLLEFFDTVFVDAVRIQLSPENDEKDGERDENSIECEK